MGVIGHAVDRNQFLAFSRDNSGDVFLQLLAMCVVDYAGATGDREDDVQVDLRVRVGHFPEVNMTLLAELITSIFVGPINMSRLRRCPTPVLLSPRALQLSSAACAAASRAIGIRNGLQLT